MTNDVRCVQSYNVWLSSCNLTIVAMAGVVAEKLQLHLIHLVSDKIEQTHRRNGAIVQPEQVWRVQIILNDLLPINVVIKYCITWVCQCILPCLGKLPRVGFEHVAPPYPNEPLVLFDCVRF